MFFSSIKEIIMLISKRMRNIYLKVTIEEKWLLKTLKLHADIIEF